MLKKHFLLLSIVFITISYSCQKQSLFWKKAEGVVYWTGDFVVDGCGYMIKIDSEKLYAPIDLPKEFEVDQLKIKFKYKLSDKAVVCSFNKQETIEVKEIETKTE